ncbi:tyrosine-type recombinase/integrase [Elusimicrobiota bacterium]
MFHQLFERPHALKRQLTSPLLEDRLRYLMYCAEQGAVRSTLRLLAHYQLVIIRHLHLTKTGAVTVHDIQAAATRWVRHQMRHSRHRGGFSQLSKGRFIWNATNWLRYVGRLKLQPTPPIPPQVTAFADYMRKERGLSEETIGYRCREVQLFLNQIRQQGHTLARITIPQIDGILTKKLSQRGHARRTIQTLAASLRVFFRYAESRHWCRPAIAVAIKAPRVYRHAALPSSPTWDEVKRLLRTTKGNRPADIRDRAILLLFALYGLRAGEVARLRLEDLDWKQEIIHLTRSKGGRPQQFPLRPSVGQAIVRYLQEVRPRSNHRHVFLTLRAPIIPLPRGALTALVSRRWKPLNVSIRHHGPHSLRHACATRLINQGVPLKTIADHLGHRDLEATRIYAKVDLPRLREVANFNIGGLL